MRVAPSTKLTTRATPPWSEDEIASLNERQQQDLHQYTCGNNSLHKALVAYRDGWHCPDCNYRQTWAHRKDTQWWWRG